MNTTQERRAVVVAAMDLGSNSFHLAVFRVRADLSLEPIAKEREMLRLGERVYQYGRFDADAIAAAVATVARFAAISESFGAEMIVAKATASFRDAENSDDLIDAIRDETGIRVQVISGHEEASLIFDAIRAACHLGSRPVLGADLGGGSLELMLGDQRQLIAARSLRLGVGRLLAKFGDDRSPSAASYIEREIAEPLGAMVSYLPTRLILTSGTMNAIGRFALSLDASHDQLDDELLARVVSRGALLEAIAIIGSLPEDRRSSLKGIDARRGGTVGFGALILTHLLAAVPVEEVWLSTWALREGVVLREATSEEHFVFSVNPAELRDDSVRELLRRYSTDEAHAQFVAAFVVLLFDSLVDVHQLDQGARERLRFAAQLHDIGAFVNRDHHDRHGRYLITAAPPRGFLRREIEIIAAIVGSHTKGDVEMSSELEPSDQYEIRVGAALVRVADALDRSHQQLVSDASCTVSEGRVNLVIHSASDLSAEMFALRRKRKLFEAVFGCPIEITIQGPQR